MKTVFILRSTTFLTTLALSTLLWQNYADARHQTSPKSQGDTSGGKSDTTQKQESEDDKNKTNAKDVGDEINTTTGNMHITEYDYEGAGIFPLEFSRYYNSQFQTTNSFGAGWTHSYSARIERIGPRTANVIRPDGAVLTFRLLGGVWTPDTDVNSRLDLTQIGSETRWLYTTSRDEIETYDGSSGLLLSIQNRAGVIQSLVRDALGRLASVAVVGRTLHFAYDAQGRITSVVDPAGNAFAYDYDAHNNLNSVTYPDGATRTYLYGDAAFPNALTGVIDENGGAAPYLNWTYVRGFNGEPWGKMT